MVKIIVSSVLAAVSFVPSLAGAHDSVGPCGGIPAEPADVTVTAPVGGVVLYALVDGPALWRESNSTEGLQTHAHSCQTGGSLGGQIIEVPADTQIIAI